MHKSKRHTKDKKQNVSGLMRTVRDIAVKSDPEIIIQDAVIDINKNMPTMNERLSPSAEFGPQAATDAEMDSTMITPTENEGRGSSAEIGP